MVGSKERLKGRCKWALRVGLFSLCENENHKLRALLTYKLCSIHCWKDTTDIALEVLQARVWMRQGCIKCCTPERSQNAFLSTRKQHDLGSPRSCVRRVECHVLSNSRRLSQLILSLPRSVLRHLSCKQIERLVKQSPGATS